MTSVEIHDSVEDLRPGWEELADATRVAPSLRPGWIDAWWRAFGKGRLAILAVRDGTELTGVLPLARRAGGLVSTTNWHTPVFGPVVRDDAAVAALAQGLVDKMGSHVRLRIMAAEDPIIGALPDAAQTGRRTLAERTMQRSPYVPINGTWEEFRAGLSRNRRKSIGRRERRLAELGEVKFTVEDGTERLDSLLEQGFALEAAGWKGERGTAIISRPETRSFYEDLARWATEEGLLRLAFLWLDERPIAFNLCLENGQSHFALKPGHDPELNKHGPGALLEYRMIERSFEIGLESHELLGDPDELKLSFAGEHFRNRKEIQAFTRSPRGVATRLVQTHGRAVARRMLARSG